MLNKCIITMTLALVTGCCEVKTVYLPVPSCPPPPPFSAPTLMVDNLLSTATTQDKLQALKIDHGTLRRSNEECKELLDAYRKPPTPTPTKAKAE